MIKKTKPLSNNSGEISKTYFVGKLKVFKGIESLKPPDKKIWKIFLSFLKITILKKQSKIICILTLSSNKDYACIYACAF